VSVVSGFAPVMMFLLLLFTALSALVGALIGAAA
jgi:hypothetical protein